MGTSEDSNYRLLSNVITAILAIVFALLLWFLLVVDILDSKYFGQSEVLFLVGCFIIWFVVTMIGSYIAKGITAIIKRIIK